VRVRDQHYNLGGATWWMDLCDRGLAFTKNTKESLRPLASGWQGHGTPAGGKGAPLGFKIQVGERRPDACAVESLPFDRLPW
jgi:hypothetical protein